MAVDHDAAEQSPELKSYYDDTRLLARNVVLLMLGGSAAGMGLNTAAQTLMPLHMNAIGMNAKQVMFAQSLNGWVGFFLIVYMSYLTDHWQSKWGRRLPFLALSLPFLVIGVFIFPYLHSAIACTILFGVVAFFSQVKYDTYPLLIYDVAKNKQWGRVNGISTLTIGIFLWLGQVWLMPGSKVWGETTTYAICAGLVLVLTIPAFFIKEPPIRSAEKPRFNPVPVFAKVLKVGFSDPRNIVMFIAYSLVCVQWLIKTTTPLQGRANLGLDDEAIGVQVLQYGTILGVALSFFMGWAVDKIGTAKCIVFGYVFAVAAAWYGFHPANARELAIAYVLSTTSISMMYIAAILFVVASVRREDLASFTACSGAINLILGAGLTNACGWMISHWFHENYGFAYVLSAVAGAPAVVIFAVYERRRNREIARGLAVTGTSTEEPDAAAG